MTTPFRKPVTVLMCVVMTFVAGCGSIRKQQDFSSLTQPIVYRAASPEPVKKTGVLAKTKEAVATTVGIVGAGLFCVAFVFLHAFTSDDDDDERGTGFDPDPMWRQGYGFNNPNNERIKNGQPVLNFDGTVAD